MAGAPSWPASLQTWLVIPAALDWLVPGQETRWSEGEDAGRELKEVKLVDFLLEGARDPWENCKHASSRRQKLRLWPQAPEV